MKRCTICHNEFPATADYFTRDRGTSDGLRSQCKSCYRAKQSGWRQENRDRYRQYGRDYYSRNPEPAKERAKRWGKSEAGITSRRTKAIRDADIKRARDRLYYKRKREVILKRALQWQKNNPDRRRAIRQRRAARMIARPVDFLTADWQFALDYFGGCCAACGRPQGLWHTIAADHWIALASDDCPGTIPQNIVPLCHGEDGCNNAKQDREPSEWLQSNFSDEKAQAINKRIHEFFSLARQITAK